MCIFEIYQVRLASDQNLMLAHNNLILPFFFNMLHVNLYISADLLNKFCIFAAFGKNSSFFFNIPFFSKKKKLTDLKSFLQWVDKSK